MATGYPGKVPGAISAGGLIMAIPASWRNVDVLGERVKRGGLVEFGGLVLKVQFVRGGYCRAVCVATSYVMKLACRAVRVREG